MLIERPRLGQITQGTIFSAASAENYYSMPTWGLCITARCDVAHEVKTEVFNYIPIVRYEDWLETEGHRIVSRRVAGELKNTLKSALRNENFSDSVLDSYDADVVVKKFFPVDVKRPDNKRQRLHETAANFKRLLALHDAPTVDKKNLRFICELAPKIYEKATRELWSNQLGGYYFFPDVGDSEFKSKYGYVALLREVHHMSRSAASAIAGGLTQQECDGKKIFGLNFSVQDFAYPVGKMSSPWIEHFMQQFAILFTRIGLPDPSEDALPSLFGAYKND